ncbi:unnamed protein product [Miscanthus lutarioriparius]|uniref:Uncharacterized protein n=1 Tax=Miscanthus lutarioriparius TaxID=422564 RepID=A0A811SKR3_9POAL|nr:unnamed protein product [Miscanthus lutarioriparius]
MLNPPLAPPAAAEDEKRPSPPLKMKLLFPYAVNCVFGGMGRAWGMAMVGLHIVLCIVKVLSFTTDPELARFWIPIFRVWVYLGIASMVLMTCVDIVYYMVKLLFPYAVSCVFSGMGRPWGMAMIGLHIVLCIVKVLSFTTDPEVARFWIPIFRIWVYLGLAAMALMTSVDIGYYLYGLYALKFDLPQQQLAAAVVLLLYLLKISLVLDNLFSICLGEDASGSSGLVIKWLCDEGINGKDQRAEKILLSLAPPVEAKIKDRWWQTSVEAHHLMA